MVASEGLNIWSNTNNYICALHRHPLNQV